MYCQVYLADFVPQVNAHFADALTGLSYCITVADLFVA